MKEVYEGVDDMSGLGAAIREEGRKEGRKEGIQALILDYLEEGFPKEKIISKLQKRFSLTKEQAEEYFYQFNQ